MEKSSASVLIRGSLDSLVGADRFSGVLNKRAVTRAREIVIVIVRLQRRVGGYFSPIFVHVRDHAAVQASARGICVPYHRLAA